MSDFYSRSAVNITLCGDADAVRPHYTRLVSQEAG